ncbi:metallophosphoesterase family protein [Phenylobacterium aquaticum]|uniref:metallophosphoesterase family protein n=1 Tax=Phenylobacterium aquaticum TaxID=1763816 RepID=UPI001F5D8C59|nr:DNA repair exonuclease [Phenylobacterium aquaticum]
MIRFIHTADWQLGKPFGRMPDEARTALQDARLDAIDAIAKLSAGKDARDVLVAGDVFDTFEPGERVVRQALTRMGRAPCRWWLLPGNHDYARAEGLWARLARDAPANVRALVAAEPVVMSDHAVILPAPLLYRRTSEDPTTVFEAMPTAPGVHRVGLAHGPIQSFSSTAAMNLIPVDRAQRSGLDYLALGDWHGFNRIGERTAYSGTPEPDDFDREVTGGALLVEIAGPGAVPVLSHHSLGRFTWRHEAWTLDGVSAFDVQIAALRAGADLARMVLRLKVSGILSLADRVAVRERLESELGLEVRWLDLDLKDLFARPTEDDLGGIDAHGVLRVAAERLLAMAKSEGPEAQRASAALERMFVENLRAARAAGAEA